MEITETLTYISLSLGVFCLLLSIYNLQNRATYKAPPKRYDDSSTHKNVPFVLLGYFATVDASKREGERALRDCNEVYGHLPRKEVEKDIKALIELGFLDVSTEEPAQ